MLLLREEGGPVKCCVGATCSYLHYSLLTSLYIFAAFTEEMIDWAGEDSSSVVQSLKVGGGVFREGEVSRVKTSQGCFEGMVEASGKNDFVQLQSYQATGTKREMEDLMKTRNEEDAGKEDSRGECE